MPADLQLKLDDINSREKRSKYSISVIGLGQKGLLLAMGFAEAGFRVKCNDSDQSLLKKIADGRIPFLNRTLAAQLKRFIRNGQLILFSDLKSALTQSSIVILTTGVKVVSNNNLDYSELENSCKNVGSAFQRGILFIYANLAPIGLTDEIIKLLENTSGLRSGEEFGFAYLPLHISNEQISNAILGQKIMIAASDQNSLNLTSKIMETIAQNTPKEIQDIKILEAAVLFDIVKNDLNFALANELAIFCEYLGINFFKVFELLQINAEDFLPAFSQEEETIFGTHILLQSAENLGIKLRLSSIARQITEDMVPHAVKLVKDALRSCGKSLRRAKIVILADAGSSIAIRILIKTLMTKGAKVILHDPTISKNKILNGNHIVKKTLNSAAESADCAILTGSPEHFKRMSFKKLSAIMKMPAAVIDLAGIAKTPKIEAEGFVYRGLGRGIKKI